MSPDVSDGDLVRLARDGDAVAFRLLVERHQAMVRARARQLGPGPGPADVDDVMQESFLQAFLTLDRLRDPDRFAGWLSGIVFNVCRTLHRRAQAMPMADWPESLHPASAEGLPSADELDRADALRTAVAGLPPGQRRAVTLHYYDDVPAGQVAEAPGAARASLHKARRRLRAHLTEHRPDLVPDPRRTHMTTVRFARVERRIPPGPVPDRFPTHVIVLSDRTGDRDLPVWLLGRDSHRFADDHPGPSQDELTGRLLSAAGTRVTAVDIDELGPEVTVARLSLATPAGSRHATVRLLDGLAMAVTAGAPIRVADALMDRLSSPAGPSQDSPVPGHPVPGHPVPDHTARDLRAGQRPRYEPCNLDFGAALGHWALGGSFAENAQESHWQDYSAAADHGSAVLVSAVPAPAGFAWLAQEIFADDYRGTAVTFRCQARTSPGTTSRAGLFLRVMEPSAVHGPSSAQAALTDPGNHIVFVAEDADWTTHEVTAFIPDEADTIAFGVFLAGPGRIALHHPELATASSQGEETP